MFDFGISVIYLRLIGIYRVGAPVWLFEKFRSLFSFIVFCLSLSLSLSVGAPLAPGPISSGAPGHCPPMPPGRYDI